MASVTADPKKGNRNWGCKKKKKRKKEIGVANRALEH